MPALVEFVTIEVATDRLSVVPCIDINGGIYNASTHGNANFMLNMSFEYPAADGSSVTKAADVPVGDTEQQRVLQGNKVRIETSVALDTAVGPNASVTSTITLSKQTTAGDEPVEPPITDITVLP